VSLLARVSSPPRDEENKSHGTRLHADDEASMARRRLQVRRDSCPVVAKTMEQAVRLLFRSDDLSRVKRYLRRQWRKILSGRVSIQDFIFCKEVLSSRPLKLPAKIAVQSCQ
jgi:hypothetical protein